MAVTPFKIEVSDAILKDLKERLDRTRWPDEMPGSGWDYGTNLDYIKELVEYWRTRFDWRSQEELINSLFPFQGRHRRPGNPLHPRKGQGPQPHATGDHPWMAWHFLRDV